MAARKAERAALSADHPASASASTAAAPKRGGRAAGVSYALPKPNESGTGRWPNRDYRSVEPDWLGDLLQDWQDIVRDARERRHALSWTQRELGQTAEVAENTVKAFEGGEWVQLPTALKLLYVLGLRLEQPVEVRVRRRVRASAPDPP